MPSDIVPGLSWPQRLTLDYECWSEAVERRKRHEDRPGDLFARQKALLMRGR